MRALRLGETVLVTFMRSDTGEVLPRLLVRRLGHNLLVQIFNDFYRKNIDATLPQIYDYFKSELKEFHGAMIKKISPEVEISGLYVFRYQIGISITVDMHLKTFLVETFENETKNEDVFTGNLLW